MIFGDVVVFIRYYYYVRHFGALVGFEMSCDLAESRHSTQQL